MKAFRSVLALSALALGAMLWAPAPARGQSGVEIDTTTPAPFRLEIEPQSPATREVTRPREADLYEEDVRLRYEPAFIEPFVHTTEGGLKFGLSGWTSPETPVGSSVSRTPNATSGWFALGLTFIWDSPVPASAARPAAAPR
jgi:hypothetical protein